MTAEGPASGWSTEVIGFLSRNLPALEEGGGWRHMFSTAYQVGCKALAALGHAEETEWGAVPRKPPEPPQVLPRWDDLCVAVLWLAKQQGMLAYRRHDGSAPPPKVGRFRVDVVGAPPPPAPNIAAAQGLGPARADPEVLAVLEVLGLVAQGRWTSDAEPVLWRGQPGEWEMDVPSDPRFVRAVGRAVETIPEGIGAEMDRLAVITEEDVAEAIARYESACEEMRERFGSEARTPPPLSTEMARKGLEAMRRNALDWLFFRHWRLADGWLPPEEAERALAIFHDRLAIGMRRAVAAQRYPGLPYLADR